MISMTNKSSKIILLLLCFFISISTLEDYLEDRYYFQLYPSTDEYRSYVFHAFTHDHKLITINSTDGENCQKIEEKTVNEYPIKGLSSVASFNKTLLIKTCFYPDIIVEIIDEKKETYRLENNNFNSYSNNLDNIKYCYSTAIRNPRDKTQLVIMTYWTEFYKEKGKEIYTHKAILFNPKTNKFSKEIYLIGSSTIIERLVNNNFYARSCITFRGVDIYCNIDLNSDNSYANSFSIDTSKIFTSEPHIHLIISNEDFGKDIFQKSIPIGKEIDSIFGGFYDAFLTEYHNEKENKTMLVSSLFRKSLFASFISISDKSKIYYGINVEDVYINQYLFNHLVPNEKELIAIYTMKTGNDMSLIMSRFKFSESTTFHSKFQEFAFSNYLRDDICPKPKHIQSIFVNSFINYSQEDKNIISNSINEKFYSLQKDIVTLIACENDENIVNYEYKKIIMPQCLNILDEINNMDKHYFKFNEQSSANDKRIEVDIYANPNYKSLRDVTIEFLPININLNLERKPLFIGVKTKDHPDYRYLTLNTSNTFTKITHIVVALTITYKINKPLSIPYRISQTSEEGSALKCHLQSDECKFEIIIVGPKCDIDYCLMCEILTCVQCENILGMVLKDNTCICDESKGLKKLPSKFQNNNERCICKDNYSFYNNRTFCMPNKILENGQYCIFDTDEASLIPIYKDLKDSEKFHVVDGLHYCKGTEPIFSSEDICLDKDQKWFVYDDNKIKYAKINNCIYIFHNNSLFFYSNKDDCLFDNLNNNIDYISDCLNGLVEKDEKKYSEFLSNSIEYNPKEENVIIYKTVDNITFHFNSDANNNNFSKIVISDSCIDILKSKYGIDKDLNLSVFIADIKRNNTISRQVEYLIYNPEPKKIYKKLDLNLCFPEINEKDRRLGESDNETDNSTNINQSEIYIMPYIDWNEKQRSYIEELFTNNNINLFDPSHDFYNDFCFKYKTPKNSDIYLEDRRKKYYINETFCSDDCKEFNYENETGRIKCLCPLKTGVKLVDETNFTKKDNFKNDDVSLPNLKILKCPKEAYETNNVGFYLTFIFLIIFTLSYLHRRFCGQLEQLTKLLNKFKEKEKFNLMVSDENKDENGDEDDDKEHLYRPKDKKKNPIKEEIKNQVEEENNKNDEINNEKYEELQNKDITEGVKSVKLSKKSHNIKNKKPNKEDIDTGEINNIKNENNEGKKESGMIAEGPNNNIRNSVIQLDTKRKENTGIKSHNNKEEKNNQLIDSSRDDRSSRVMIEKETYDDSENSKKEDKKDDEDKKDQEDKKDEDDKKDENDKKEEDDKKGKKKDKRRKRSKSKKKIKDDTETKTTENEKNSMDPNNNNKKKRKKSKSKTKKKINLISSEKSSESQTITKNPSEKDYDKISEARMIKEQQQNENYDKDMDKASNADDFITKKLAKLKESQDFDAILNEKSKVKKKDNSNKDEKEIELDGEKDDNDDDHDKEYDINDVNDEENKSENTDKKKKKSNKKGKKKGKKKKNVANPNKKNDIQNDRLSYFSEIKDVNSAERINKKGEKNKNKFVTDYILDKSSFNSKLLDNRGLLELIFSMIKNNNTIFFIIFPKENDLFTLVSVIILSLSFYIFLNTFFMFNSSSQHLFIDQDFDLKEKTKGNYFFLNILVPCLLYIATSKIKQMTSINEFINDKNYQYEKILNNKGLDKYKKIKIHDLMSDINKFKNKIEDQAFLVFIGGILFLIYNWYFITCYLGIYNNSYDCLILNVFISLIFTLIFTTIIFVISSTLRYFGKALKLPLLFSISQLLNPIYNFYNELPYNEQDGDDDDNDNDNNKKKE